MNDLQYPGRPVGSFSDSRLETVERLLADMESSTGNLQSDLMAYIVENPLDPKAFALLGEVYDRSGKQGEAIVCLERALQLKELSEGYRPSAGAQRLEVLQKASAGTRPVVIGEHTYPLLRCVRDRWGSWMEGLSLDGRTCLRIQLEQAGPTGTAFLEEAALRQQLCDKGCQCLVPVLSQGLLPARELVRSDAAEFPEDGPEPSGELPYLVEAFTPSDRGYYVADILFGVFELAAMGYTLLDLGTDNIRYDEEAGILRFRRLAETVATEPAQEDHSPRAFLDFLDSRCREHSTAGKGIWSLYPGLLPERDIEPLFRKQAFNLKQTHAFSEQKTTGHELKAYHAIDETGYFCEGLRSLSESRRKVIVAAFSSKPESVIDLGCGSGQLTFLIASLGHKVQGLDSDNKLVNGCNVFSNILQSTGRFRCADLDLLDELESADTILAMDILPHTEDPEGNARKLARAAKNRILVEGQATQEGFKWMFNHWEKQPGWSFDSPEDWIRSLTAWLDGFVLSRDFGEVDGGSRILEFQRKGTRSHGR